MYLLDTNVISELRRPEKADRNVMAWASAQPVFNTFISAITILEIELGTLQIARKDIARGLILRSWIDEQILPRFADRILAVDVAVAQHCARLHIPNSRSDRDAMIAATGLVHGMTVVTRNISDFELSGVPLLNPWITPLTRNP